jgi:hypothetical protein
MDTLPSTPPVGAEMSVVGRSFFPSSTNQIEVIQMSTTTVSPTTVSTTTVAAASDTDSRAVSLSEADLRTMLLEQNERRRVSGFDRIVMRVSLVALLWARHHAEPTSLPHAEQLRLVLNDRAREARQHSGYLAALRLR